MSHDQKKFYVTTPIYYVNARPHIGHAYTTIVADVLARRHRLQGENVFFLTGTDEHGQKIERSAAAAGVPPQQFTDEVSAAFQRLWDRMGLTYTKFIRTTDPEHARGVQMLFRTLYERGFIYLSTYTGQYCVSEEMFVEGPPGTIGPDGKPTETVTEENFFFRLSAFQRPLIDLIETGALAVEPEARRNEVLSFLRGNVTAAYAFGADTGIQPEAKYGDDGADTTHTHATAVDNGSSPLESTSRTHLANSDLGNPYVPGALKDLSISRSSFTWGIPVPSDVQQAAGATQNHVIYVWLDALANYITAIGYGADSEEAQPQFGHYWPADLHLVGKEIIRFHCVYWPAFLLAAGLSLPKAITAHGWLLFDNSKMSKSKGNIVRTETILQAFGDEVYGKQFPESTREERDLFASDVLRYFLLREIPFGQDGSFSFDALVTRYNADLANGYGNLVSRVLNMIAQYFGGEYQAFGTDFYFDWVQYAGTPNHNWISFGDVVAFRNDSVAKQRADDQEPSDSLAHAVKTYIYDLQFTKATDTLMQAVSVVDAYITKHAPWKLAKQESTEEQLAEVLMNAAEAVKYITASAYDILPFVTARVWQQLGLGDIAQAAARGELKDLQWGGLKPGTKLGALAPIFPRADKGLAQTMNDMENPQPTTQNSPLQSTPGTRPEAPLKQAFTPTTPAPVPSDPTHPAAPPVALDEPSGSLPVAGSSAITSNTDKPTSHTQAPTSGAFASAASQTPITATPSDASPQIGIDDFAKVELRVAEIKVCERIPKADKLLRLEVDLGHEQRQILSGIAEFYTPEELVGRRIVVITNLAPRKMRGLDSHGMLLAASGPDGGKPILATVGEGVPLGARLK